MNNGVLYAMQIRRYLSFMREYDPMKDSTSRRDSESSPYTYRTDDGRGYTNPDGSHEYTDLILNNPEGYIIFLAKMMYLGNCSPASEHPARLDPRNTLENEAQLSVKEIWYPENRGIGYTCYGDMTAEESETYAAKAGDIATYLEEYMAKVIAGEEDINATYDTMIETCFDLGLQEVLDIKQAAHDRYLAR